ncbi:MAG: hypothetical protein GC152_12445 [Alphaproteobacteria bacterium]|nr:hypothetical protein [Alphaproteobacteria bacterium]
MTDITDIRARSFRGACAALAALALSACATANGVGYQPADDKGFGYSDTRIESDRFRITFAGDGATPPDAVEAFALRRAAELALANGFDWFRVAGRSTDRDVKGGANIGLGFGSGSYGRGGGVGVGVGGDVGRVGAREFFTSRLEVLMGKGTPPDDPDVYDARSLLENVGGEAAPAA